MQDNALATRWRAWLQHLRPARLNISPTERWRVALGGLLGILLTGLLGRMLHDQHLAAQSLPWLVAPLGASAVLVFGVPSSPLAQPWAVVGGNTLSALTGIACGHLIADPALAGAVAVCAALLVMMGCRCLHPPGGAMALLTSMGHVPLYSYAAFPALFDSAALVAVGMAFNHLTGKRYPHPQQSPAAPSAPRQAASATTTELSDDLQAVLRRHNEVLDVSEDALLRLVQDVQARTHRRLLGDLSCQDVMSSPVVTVQFGDSLQDAWHLMHTHHLKALPVVDRWHKLVGIVTLADFMRHADLSVHEHLGDRLKALIRRVTTVNTDKPDAVGQIMTRQVRVISASRPLMDLAAMFSEGGHHHIPVIDEQRKLVGMLTQTDFLRALNRTVQAASGPAVGT